MNRWALTLGLVLCACGATAASADITTFDDGDEGWFVNGLGEVSSTGGNPGACLDAVVQNSTSFDLDNYTNPAFLGDYTELGAFRLTIDVNVEALGYFGAQGWRDLTVQLIDVVSMDPPEACGVWANIGMLAGSMPGWYTYSIDVLDPMATELPEGWEGLQPDGSLGLPEGRTFTSVLESVDAIRFSTSFPGVVPSPMNYDLVIDNVGVMAIPEPTTLSLLGLGIVGLIRRRR